MEYQWGIRKTWRPDRGGHTEIDVALGEMDARTKVKDWTDRKERGGGGRLTAMQVVRRPVGNWEDA